MSVEIDTSSNSTYQTASSSYSWSHTCNGSNRQLLVGVMILSNSSNSATVTYNGVSMTSRHNRIYNSLRLQVFSIDPASGANTIAVTLTGSCDSIGLAVSLVDVNQVIPLGNTDNENFNTDSGGGTATVSLTGLTFRHYLLGWFVSNDPDGVTLLASTQLEQVSGAAGLAAVAYKGPLTVATQNIVYQGINSGSDWILYGISVFDIFNPVWGQGANKIIHGVSA